MESVLSNYEEGKNFWKLYPSYKVPKLYKQLYTNDKSKGKSASSNLMWALHFLFDKSEDNPWARFDQESRVEVINEDVLLKKEFNWKPYSELMDYTQNMLWDEMDRMYYTLVNKMDQRSTLLKDTDYSIENAASLDKLFISTDNLREELKKMKDGLTGKGNAGKSKGGMPESAGEKGEI